MICVKELNVADSNIDKYLCGAADIEKICFKDPWSGADIKTMLDNAFCKGYVICDAENSKKEIVAFCIYSHVLDEAELFRIAVIPEARRNGLGKILLEKMLEDWNRLRISRAFLEVRSSNTAARALYEKYGFKPLGVRKKYYNNAEDAVVYIRNKVEE